MSNPTRCQPVPLAQAYRLLNHGPVTLITSAHQGHRNIMAASWVMPLDFDPPKVAAVIDRSAYSRELIEASGHFVLNLPTRAQAAQVLAAGGKTGRGIDKLPDIGFETFTGESGLPLVAGCAGWLECRVLPEESVRQRYDLILADVTAAWADPALFSQGRWQFTDDSRRTLHYIAGGAFFATGEAFEVDAPQD